MSLKLFQKRFLARKKKYVLLLFNDFQIMSNNHHLSIQYLSEEDQKALHKIGRKLDSLRYFPTAAFRIIARNRHFQMFRSEEHTSELQSRGHLVCSFLL